MDYKSGRKFVERQMSVCIAAKRLEGRRLEAALGSVAILNRKKGRVDHEKKMD
jgi:hypothetical protein